MYERLEAANLRLHRLTEKLASVAERPGESAAALIAGAEGDSREVDAQVRGAYRDLAPELGSEERRRAQELAARAPAPIRPEPAREITIADDGRPQNVGGFDIAGGASTIADAANAFGPSYEIDDEGSDPCSTTRWSEPQLEILSTGPIYPNCDQQLVQEITIRSEDFATEAGLRVGMSVEELQRRHPQATTRGGAQLLSNPEPDEGYSVYTIDSVETGLGPTGRLATLAAFAKDDVVVAIVVTPFLGGE